MNLVTLSSRQWNDVFCSFWLTSTKHIHIEVVTMMKRERVLRWKLGGGAPQPRFQRCGGSCHHGPPPPGSCVPEHYRYLAFLLVFSTISIKNSVRPNVTQHPSNPLQHIKRQRAQCVPAPKTYSMGLLPRATCPATNKFFYLRTSFLNHLSTNLFVLV